MSRAEMITWVVGCCVAVAVAYGVGRQNGLRTAPDRVAYQIQQDAERKAFMKELEAMPSGREMVCDRIFDLVLDEASDNLILEQEERARE